VGGRGSWVVGKRGEGRGERVEGKRGEE